MSFRKIGFALTALGLTVTLAACEMPEEPTTKAEAAEVEKALKKHAKKKNGKAESGPKETLAQKNARKSAESYLDGPMAFSKSGLIKQLKFEGFSKADAGYAVDAIDPNWNKQAAKSAKTYLDGPMSFSKSGLADQLEFEGFTDAQVAYGVEKAGY
jgi:hypothetical protein